MPPGGIFHMAGPTAGGWCVVDAWESQAVFEKFRDEKMGPITQRHGFPAPKVTVFPIHNTLKP